jgi:hypothetical protein
MEKRDLVIGAAIGLLIGLISGYMIIGDNSGDIDALNVQLADLTGDVIVLGDNVEGLESQVAAKNAQLQQKNVIITSLREEVSALEGQIADIDELNLPTPQNTRLGVWESVEVLFYEWMSSTNFTVTQDTLILKTIVPQGEVLDAFIVLVNSDTGAHVYEIIKEDAISGVDVLVVTPGTYWIYGQGDVPFTVIAEEPKN